MIENKHCLKHPSIKTEESCRRCKAPLCPDCRIRSEKRPYCSSWCLFHDRAAERLSALTRVEPERPSQELGKLVFISDLVITLIILSFATASFHFYEGNKKSNITMHAVRAESVGKEELILARTAPALMADPPSEAQPHPETLPEAIKESVSEPVRETAHIIKKERSQRRVKKTINRWPRSISRVMEAGKKVSITFDGGSSDSSATNILHVLAEKKIKTTFFLTGQFIKRYPDLVKRMLREGHEIGNHTYSHPHLTTYSMNRKSDTAKQMSFKKLKEELEKTANLYRQLTGEMMAPFWRAPYGEINEEISHWASIVGYRHIAWTVDYKARQSMDSLDWVADRQSTLYLSAEEIREKLLSFADGKGRAEGGIILMHLGTERKEDVAHEKLGEIIDGFMGKGYQVVPVSALVKVMNPEESGKKL